MPWLILGHAYPTVVKAVKRAAERGTSYGASRPLEIDLAQSIQRFMPGLEMMRFVNSGTEATMSALRLARAFTGRSKIIKFEGCYHGHADLMLVQAGSGVATLGLPDSPGVPPATVQDTLVARFNDLDTVEALFERFRGEIAAVIVEPVAGNMGVVPPLPGFLQGLRDLSNKHGALLIFDEVMTGFRVHLGGAQALYGIKPDLTTLGKVIGVEAEPERINQDPYGDGWLAFIQPDDWETDRVQLLDAHTYFERIREQAEEEPHKP